MKEDRQKHGTEGDVSSAAYDETQTAKQDVLLPDATSQQQPPPPAKAKDPDDMFADDDDDMFADDTQEAPQPTQASAKSAVP